MRQDQGMTRSGWKMVTKWDETNIRMLSGKETAR